MTVKNTCISTISISSNFFKYERKITRKDYKQDSKNTVISSNFLVWKFCGKAQFLVVSGESVVIVCSYGVMNLFNFNLGGLYRGLLYNEGNITPCLKLSRITLET